MEQDIDTETLTSAISKAFSLLTLHDGDLFGCPIIFKKHGSRKLHEVSINHKLANYLESTVLPLLTGSEINYYVDIEFNREGKNDKMLPVNAINKLVRPDIIIHNRETGGNKSNFLAIECKKKGSPRREIDYDKKKLMAFLNEEKYDYKFALQVIYNSQNIQGTLFSKGHPDITITQQPRYHQGH